MVRVLVSNELAQLSTNKYHPGVKGIMFVMRFCVFAICVMVGDAFVRVAVDVKLLVRHRGFGDDELSSTTCTSQNLPIS
jgi:hypothetical protein